MTRLLAGLRIRLLLLVLLAVIPALGLVLITGQEHRHEAGQQVGQHLLRLARVASTEQVRLIQETRQFLGAIALLPEVRGVDDEACTAALAELLSHYHQYGNLFAVRPDGSIRCGGPSADTFGGLERPHVRLALTSAAFSIGEYVLDPVTRRAALLLGYPVVDGQGDVQFVLSASLDLTWLEQFAAVADLPAGSRLAMHDHTGTVLVRYPNPEQWVGRATPGGLISQGLKSGAREGIGEGTGAEGIARIFAFTPMGSAGPSDEAYLSLAVSSAVAYAEADALLRRNLVGLGSVAALALVAAWFGSEPILLRRLRALIHAADRLACGDLGSRSGLAHDRGEIGQLARSFDDMAESLQERSQERARLLSGIEEERATLAGVMAGMSQGVLVLDSERAVRYCNARAGNLLGLELVTLRDASIHAIIRQLSLSDSERVALQGQLEYTLDELGAAAPVALEMPGPPCRSLLLEVFPLARTDGAAHGACVLIRDVTTEREIERTKDELVAVVSHELRTPLAAVLGFADLMLERDLSKEQRHQYLSVIVQEGRRLTSLVNDFLDLQRMTAGSRCDTADSIDMGELLEQALVAAEPDTMHPISLQRPPWLPILQGDHGALLQVTSNLLSNAKKYSPAGGPIHVNVRLLGTEIEVSVRDHGLGLPPESVTRIFEKFYRVDNSDRRTIKGTGLGLAICQRIIEDHGGRIQAESEGLGLGTCIRFTLPVNVDALANATQAIPRDSSAPPALAARGPLALTRP